MPRIQFFLLPVSASLAAATNTIVLATFQSDQAATYHSWEQKNDPVMGGQSSGTFTVDFNNGVGIFDGEVKDVPSLQAPGFIKAQTIGERPLKEAFPDVENCEGIAITAKASDAYAGYRFSFGKAHVLWGKFFAYGYKADFAPAVGEFSTVELPFESFTDYWDDATGDAIVTCLENEQYCPDARTKRDIRTMSVWAEGVNGLVHLELKEIAAYGCSAEFYT